MSNNTISSEYSIASVLQDIQEIDVTIFLLSLPLNEVYQVICYVYKYQNHLMWPKYVWIVYGHWFEDILNEQRVTHYPRCTRKEIEYAVEGLMLFNLHLEPEDENHVIVSGQTYKEYITSIPSSTVSERYRSNVAFGSLWALALAVNSTADTPNSTSISVSDRHTYLELSVTDGGNHTKVDTAQVSGRIYINIGCSSNEGVYVNTSLFDFIPLDSLPRVQVELESWAMYLFTSVTVAIAIYVAAVTIVYMYFRKEPEIKATSPYLNLIGFAGLFMILTGVQLSLVIRSEKGDYVSVPICTSTVWVLNHGDALYIITLLVKLVRIYRAFSYFGKMSRIWSDAFLLVVIVGLVSVVTVNNLLWTVFNTPKPTTQEVVSNGMVLVETYCDFQVGIWIYSCIVYALLLRLFLVTFSVMTRNIQRKHFKDTKKINFLIYLNILIGVVFVQSSLRTTHSGKS